MKNKFEKLISYVEKHREMIFKTERHIWANPEVGYKEWETTEYLIEQFEKLGYSVVRPGNITGFIADLDTGRPGPKFAIIGELDSLMSETHPEANPETKAIHACGHHCQTTILLACAAALAEPDALDGMSGSIRFMAVPAEETIDMEFRSQLIKRGIIRYNAGKIEYLYRGFFDDVDMAALFHTFISEDYLFNIMFGADGCINKHFEFKGKASHAGVAPWDGVNALYAASIGITACNAVRETFKDRDFNRFHPIITQAGVAANAIPDVAKMDAYVRGASFDSMIDVNSRINRALTASAASLGAQLTMEDKPGNMPLHCNKDMLGFMDEIIRELFGENKVLYTDWSAVSTDLGDISTLIPVIHPEASGAVGSLHGNDFMIADAERACINPAKVMVCFLYKLLSEDANIAKRIIDSYQPVFSNKEEYFEAINSVQMSAETIKYLDNGDILLQFNNRVNSKP